MRKKNGLASTLVSVKQGNIRYPRYPGVTDPLVELNGPLGGFGLKVRRGASQAESRHYLQL